MKSNYDLIKEKTNIYDVCERYGVEINRHGFARCPFHSERTGSLKLYRDGGFHCFGCGAHGGSQIDFVMKLFDLSFKEACEKLNDDFCLGIPLKKQPMSRMKQMELQRQHYERKKAKEKVEIQHRALIDEFNQAIAQIRQMEEAIDTDAPSDPDAEWSDSFCYALATRSFARQRADEALDALAEFEKNMYARG